MPVPVLSPGHASPLAFLRAALRAATEVNAGFMTGGDNIGVLEPGRAADFIALDFSPLTDIRLLQDKSRIKAVHIAGKEIHIPDRPTTRARSPTSHSSTGPISTPGTGSPNCASSARTLPPPNKQSAASERP